MTSTNNLLLEAALRYAELGYPVFPCAPGGKVPLTEHGFLQATTDPAVIEEWWLFHPSANVGIATAGLAVIDIDGTSNPWLAGAPERGHDLAVAPLSLTPRGGNHRLFRQPAGKRWRCTEGRLAEQVDTRADGGYLVVPPSMVEGGKGYRWAPGMELDDPPEQLPTPPSWLVADLDRLATDTPAAPVMGAGDADANAIPAGQRNATLARLAGTMRRVGMSRDEIAAAILQANRDRCRPPLALGEVERIATSVARYQADEVAVALAENHWDQMYAESSVNEGVGNADPGPVPEEMLRVPGFIDEVVKFTLETAPYPEPVLAFCGALTLQAFLAGRKVRDAADNRTALYLVGLANSGAGKDHPRKVNQKVLLDAGLVDGLGDTFASGEGIEDRLFMNPAVLFQTDEIDGLMTKINQGKESRHEGIMNVLLKMYTSAASLYPMRVKAGKESGVIDQPALCIFGTAIPKHYYEALSVKMLSNGFFARLLILEAGKRRQGQDVRVRELPSRVRETARWWAEFRPGEKRGNLADWHPVPQIVEYTAEGLALMQAFRRRADEEYARAEVRGDEAGMTIWARANEKALRLALIYACSADPQDLRITDYAARWASAFIEHQTRRMLFMTAGHVSEGDFDARCKKVVATLRFWREQHGDAWMPFWQINRKHPWSERDHDDVRTALLNQRLVEYTEVRTGGRPSRMYRLMANA